MIKQNKITPAMTKEDENVLSLYLKEINTIPLLTREEEVDCARRAILGEEAARQRLIRGNLRFVVNVAKKYQNQGLPLADLISEGNIGLINALEKYDPEKGYHFISYAVWWIRQSILKAIFEKVRMIRLPLNRSGELSRIEKVRKALQNQNGSEPDHEAIAQDLHMTPAHVGALLAISRDTVSLDTPVYDERESADLSDYIESTGYPAPEEEAIHASLVEEIDEVLSTLPEKESNVIRYRFGLGGLKAHSLKEIGDKYNLTKERIRQIEKKAIRRLQHPSRTQALEMYIA
ncbi:MAG: RNA polymerase sigma factor RpoD/SigA [Spirochaetales bacterium]|jgi:RNA polymerase primary sigma factor|nr:RNA polymerase sigma factor RpoD/SigA [Spirochaetales bacterium]